MDEKLIIKEAQEGSKGALNMLLTENYKTVLGFCMKMTGEPSLAQDITQETMLKAVLNIKKFKPEAKFSTWLIKIAVNTYRDGLRKNKNIDAMDEEMEARDPGTEEAAISGIEYREVIEIILGLPYEKRMVFILKHFYGYKYEEIAEILSCPVGTVRSRLHNCIKKIISDMEGRKII